MSKDTKGPLPLVGEDELEFIIKWNTAELGFSKESDEAFKRELIELCGWTEEEVDEHMAKTHERKLQTAAEEMRDQIEQNSVVVKRNR